MTVIVNTIFGQKQFAHDYNIINWCLESFSVQNIRVALLAAVMLADTVVCITNANANRIVRIYLVLWRSATRYSCLCIYVHSILIPNRCSQLLQSGIDIVIQAGPMQYYNSVIHIKYYK